MDRTQRSELLARLPDEDLAALSALVEDEPVGVREIVSPPTVGMVMMRMIEGAQGEIFNFGEVLVTECTVSVSGHEGWSMVMGSRLQGALAAATVDAALEAGHTRRPAIERRLRDRAAELDADLADERDRLAATRVQFETQ